MVGVLNALEPPDGRLFFSYNGEVFAKYPDESLVLTGEDWWQKGQRFISGREPSKLTVIRLSETMRRGSNETRLRILAYYYMRWPAMLTAIRMYEEEEERKKVRNRKARELKRLAEASGEEPALKKSETDSSASGSTSSGSD